MATLYSAEITAGQQARSGLGHVTKTAQYTVTASLATNDIIQMVSIPANHRIVEVVFSSNASVASTASLEVGDGSDTDRFISAASHASGAIGRMNNVAGSGYLYTSADTIDVKAVSITTPVAGTVITLSVTYTNDN